MTADDTGITSAAVDRMLYLLDDDANFRATAKWWLGGIGYQVIDFEDPCQALDILKALTPSDILCACLLLDVRMPTMTGLQVHDELIKTGITGPQAKPALPIIYMTGHGDVPLAVQAMEKGAITFLEKPFHDQALELALERAFSSHQDVPAEPETQTNPVAIDLSSVTYHHRLATLTEREMTILKYMLKGKTSKIIARDINVSYRTVEYLRARIAKKMKADSLVHLIRMATDERAY